MKRNIEGKIFFLILFGFTVNTSVAQHISVEIKNLENEKAYFSSLSGEKITLIDSINAIGKEKFKFNLDNPKYHIGLYRLSFDKNKWIDFVNDGEDVIITTNANNVLDSLQVVSS
ncbi:MAG: hypothetical protein NTZ27_09010 [Ignavibacteriales bacterium]|nr:hypothetical protein [Ignavibacteriales bacterium]